MSMVNALIAFTSSQVEGFLDNFRYGPPANPDEGRTPVRLRTDFSQFQTTGTPSVTLDPYDRLHLRVDEQTVGLWKKQVVGGPITTTLLSIMMTDVTQPDVDQPTDDKLAMIEYMRVFFDGRFQVLGVWKQDGVMHGQVLVPATYDMDGVELTPESVTGTPTYPLFPGYLNWMPDVVTYDTDGHETSRTGATEFAQVNQMLGWEPRRA